MIPLLFQCVRLVHLSDKRICICGCGTIALAPMKSIVKVLKPFGKSTGWSVAF
ncbi:hypothetical protein Cflav_PD4323 [Pedosphaera parvula Ellin514]|uniref:Uncharacterized protein n=1 Tax=Pedosphaera parvula (strain Ellin514) TaxID=320771 RepID=B9XFD8_PEDPL|nr:hypothetical protein Cflav_PD4323 [Pedosphaera parvula Ellin514]